MPIIALPLHEVASLVVLIQALIFAGVLSAPAFRDTGRTWFLVAALVILATIKADQLYQALGGLRHYPQFGFLLAPFQALMTPTLYLYVKAKTSSDIRLKRSDILHGAPFLFFLIYLFLIYYRLDASDKIALLETGGFNAPLHRLVVPLVGDILQFCYVVAAYRRIEVYGVSLRNWFSHVEDLDLRWLKRLLMIWGCVFVVHATWTVAGGAFNAAGAARTVITGLNIVHLMMANALMLMGVTQAMRPGAPPPAPANVEEKYKSSAMSAEERAALFEKAAALAAAEQLFLDPDLTLKDLAARTGATPRELSEAINGAGGKSFFEFVNAMRVDHAKKLLQEKPPKRILDVAYASGFNSKTAFYDAFKRAVGQTPSGFRQSAGGAE
ncbi:MAG: helix-turn-helix domain-containing protein [Pseudomonadota bacterium]